MAQLNYGFASPKGQAGGLFDVSPAYDIQSRINGEDLPGKMKFGIGVVQGDNAGVDITLPASDSTKAEFEGITLNSYTNEHDMYGGVMIRHKASIGVLRRGNVWVRIAEDIDIVYGDPVYMITSGNNAGYFTNESTGNLAINAKFGKYTDNGIALVELFDNTPEKENE